jgi:hypothetical protein
MLNPKDKQDSAYEGYSLAVGMKRNRTILVAYNPKLNRAMYLDEEFAIAHERIEVSHFEFIRWATNDDVNVVPIS